MPVVFILDYYGIDEDEALCVEANHTAIQTAKQQIDKHLETSNSKLLRVRLKSPALFKHFSDYEGMNDVLPTQQPIPRLLLAKSLKTPIPDWLTNQLIVDLNLLQNQKNQEIFEKADAHNTANFTFENRLLKSFNPDLLNCEITAFIHALSQQNQPFLQLLTIEAVKNTIKQHLILGLSLAEEVASILINELLHTNSIPTFLNQLAYQQHLQQLRAVIQQNQLNQALPPKDLPDVLLNALPLLPLTEENANGLPAKYISVLQTIERESFQQKINPEILCDCLVDWPSLLTELTELIDNNNQLISDALLDKLAAFDSEQSEQLLAKLKQRSRHYPELNSDSDIEKTILWCEDYFDYCRSLFLDKQPINESINLSFSDWLLKQSARILRSDSSWHVVSKQIKAYLEQSYVVVVVMVDALSALNQDIVLAELAELNQLNLHANTLFAPLPTLTEVCKMSVLTGVEAIAQQGNSQSEILQNHYQDYLPEEQSLKVLKSWAERSERIEEQTQLLVYFENRLDERLHECPSFNKHRDDIKPIIKQIKKSIESWRKDAAGLNKDIVFFITADHGMTVTSEFYQGEALGQTKERVFKNPQKIANNLDFVSLNDYIIPKKRWRLTQDGLLTHGGLTPEEVMIPFITLCSEIRQPSKTPLEVSLQTQKAIRLDNKVWQVDLMLIANTDISDIQINFNAPFNGKESLDSLRTGKNQILKLNFSSEHEQQGLIELELHLKYKRSDNVHEENTKLFQVEFPIPLIEKDADTQSFEDMF